MNEWAEHTLNSIASKDVEIIARELKSYAHKEANQARAAEDKGTYGND